MKKQNLKEDISHESKEKIPRKIPWHKLGEINLNDLKKIIAEHDRVLIYTIEGSIFELTEMEF